jgi:uncharacterized protein YkuJ
MMAKKNWREFSGAGKRVLAVLFAAGIGFLCREREQSDVDKAVRSRFPASPSATSSRRGSEVSPPSTRTTSSLVPSSSNVPRFTIPIPVPLPNAALELRKGTTRSLEEIFESEAADPGWRQQMEALLSRRFDPEYLKSAGVSQMKLERTECRASTCRLEIAYPLQLARESDPDPREQLGPINRLQRTTGDLSSIGNPTRIERFERDGEVWIRLGLVVAFQEKDIDPEEYPRWQLRTLQRRQAGVRN